MTLGVGDEQLWIFLLFWAISVVIATVFLLLDKLCKKYIWVVVADVMFCSMAFCLFFACNLHFNNGAFRIFPLFAMALGFKTAHICFARPLDKVVNKLYNLFTNKKVDKNGKDIL